MNLVSKSSLSKVSYAGAKKVSMKLFNYTLLDAFISTGKYNLRANKTQRFFQHRESKRNTDEYNSQRVTKRYSKIESSQRKKRSFFREKTKRCIKREHQGISFVSAYKNGVFVCFLKNSLQSL